MSQAADVTPETLIGLLAGTGRGHGLQVPASNAMYHPLDAAGRRLDIADTRLRMEFWRMTASEIVSYIGDAAASGVIGNRIDSFVSALAPVRKLHEWLRARLIDPAAVEPSPTTTSWVNSLGNEELRQFGALLREAIGSAQTFNVRNSGGVTVGNNNYGTAIGNDNYGTVIGSQNYYGISDADSAWEYAKISYGQEGDFDRPGQMKWAAYIKRPDADRLDVRDHVRIEEVLNELGQEGWQLVSQEPAIGINTTDYMLRRRKHTR